MYMIYIDCKISFLHNAKNHPLWVMKIHKNLGQISLIKVPFSE